MLKRPLVIEVIDDDMAEVLRHKSGIERQQIADAMFLSARELIECSIRTTHPDWSNQQVEYAIARRIAGDSD